MKNINFIELFELEAKLFFEDGTSLKVENQDAFIKELQNEKDEYIEVVQRKRKSQHIYLFKKEQIETVDLDMRNMFGYNPIIRIKFKNGEDYELESRLYRTKQVYNWISDCPVTCTNEVFTFDKAGDKSLVLSKACKEYVNSPKQSKTIEGN